MTWGEAKDILQQVIWPTAVWFTLWLSTTIALTYAITHWVVR